jgi:hypothetical protein
VPFTDAVPGAHRIEATHLTFTEHLDRVGNTVNADRTREIAAGTERQQTDHQVRTTRQNPSYDFVQRSVATRRNECVEASYRQLTRQHGRMPWRLRDRAFNSTQSPIDCPRDLAPRAPGASTARTRIDDRGRLHTVTSTPIGS